MRSIFFLLVVSLLANCDDTFHDGPCPHPDPGDISKVKTLEGNYWIIQNNYEDLKDNPMYCARLPVKNVDGNLLGTLIYTDSKKKHHAEKVKFVLMKDQPGRWANYVFDESKGDYVPDGWNYTLIEAAGDDKNLALLSYACKETGNKHQSFYRIGSSKLPINKKAHDFLLDAYKKSKDDRPLFTIDNKGCKLETTCDHDN